MLLALLLYRFQLSEQIVSIGILAIYTMATFLAGFLTGKGVRDRRFFWGLVAGTLYFVLLAALTFMVNHGF